MSHPAFQDLGNPLGHFIEECGEALTAAGKIVRFGFHSRNPLSKELLSETNEEWLKREVEDLEKAIVRLKTYRQW